MLKPGRLTFYFIKSMFVITIIIMHLNSNVVDHWMAPVIKNYNSKRTSRIKWISVNDMCYERDLYYLIFVMY